MVVNESQEVAPVEPASADQMNHAELRKDAETTTSRDGDPRKDIVAAREQLRASTIQKGSDVKSPDELAIPVGDCTADT